MVQSVTAVLGERDQEPRVRVRHSEISRRRLVSVRYSTDIHGQLFNALTTT